MSRRLLTLLSLACLVGVLGGGVMAGAAGASRASDLAQAKKGLLTLSDLPHGWTATSAGNPKGSSSFAGAEELAGCLNVPSGPLSTHAPTAYSREFGTDDQKLTVTDDVVVDRSAKASRAEFEAIASAKTPGCLAKLMNGSAKSELAEGIPSGSSLGTMTVSRLPGRDFAPGTTNFTVSIPITYDEATLHAHLTIVEFVRGDEEQQVTFTSVQSTFPASLTRHLTTVADARI